MPHSELLDPCTKDTSPSTLRIILPLLHMPFLPHLSTSSIAVCCRDVATSNNLASDGCCWWRADFCWAAHQAAAEGPAAAAAAAAPPSWLSTSPVWSVGSMCCGDTMLTWQVREHLTTATGSLSNPLHSMTGAAALLCRLYSGTSLTWHGKHQGCEITCVVLLLIEIQHPRLLLVLLLQALTTTAKCSWHVHAACWRPQQQQAG